MAKVVFRFLTGLKTSLFLDAQLLGSWDDKGRYSANWCNPAKMRPVIAEDGCPAFELTVDLQGQEGIEFQWGVTVSTATQQNIWGIMPEARDRNSSKRERTFVLGKSDSQEATYYFTHARRTGAQKYFKKSDANPPTPDEPALRFVVWAPNAQKVSVVTARTWNIDDAKQTPIHDSINIQKLAGAYIDPTNIDKRFEMTPIGDGYWATNPNDAELRTFSAFDHRPFMFEITREQGEVRYRTDLHSRCQIGAGTFDPHEQPYRGRILDLNGIKGCSVVINLDTVTQEFEERNETGDVLFPETKWVSAAQFWQDEFRPNRPISRRVEDLVIYELYLGSLGFDHGGPGTLQDAMKLLDYLGLLGINAIELLPLSEFGDGGYNWGYATSHYFAIEYAGGGRDKFKFFIRECHRRGIAVIADVVYNHFTFDPERAEEYYDSHRDENNEYYWYEGKSSDYPHASNGYVQNGSSGRAPRYYEEAIRQMFISSAAVLIDEFHIDGFRVDLTQAFHRDNNLEVSKRPVADANIFGAKFLREWCRTLSLLKPGIILIAEDHTGWPAVLNDPNDGGLGFTVTWYADFYHNLNGDTQHGGAAWLLKNAGYGDQRPLAMDVFANVLRISANRTVVYHISHDEAGNSGGTRRTISTAVNGAPLVGATRIYAESRSRVAFSLSLLAAGTPMFLFGEEVGSDRVFLHDQVIAGKVDLLGMRAGIGSKMFQYYADIIRVRLLNAGLRSRNIDVIFCHNDHRLLVFHRWNNEGDDFLIVVSLNNSPFDHGYVFNGLRIPNGGWREMFNSDAVAYGGQGVGNLGGTVFCREGQIEVVIPANGVIIFKKSD